jgi:hypothetical protein
MGKEQSREHKSADHLNILGAKQHLSTVQAIGKYASHERKENNWQLAEEQVQSQVKGILGEVVHQPALGELLDESPDRRATRAKPHESEVAVREGTEGAAQER